MTDWRERRTPTARELEVLAEFARTGSQKEAAQNLGIGLNTLKRHLTLLYEVLGVGGSYAALRALGWLRVPGDADAPKAHAAIRLRASIADAERVLRDIEQ